MGKPLVLYCDDQKVRFIEPFKLRHKENYTVIDTDDAADVIRMLDGMEKKPDLILLDLFHPRNHADVDCDLSREANLALQDLNRRIAEVETLVNRAWTPQGITVLREIRRKYSREEIPVVIYTQKGLIFLEDGQIREIESLGADVLLKDSAKVSETTERLFLDNKINEAKENWARIRKEKRSFKNKLRRDVVISTISVLVGFGLSLLSAAYF
ncbi:MAG: hypothetical protein K9H25_24015 [Rhodospirillum sp.]|nr:hypothetical protein [Rhodospirillum sp.]MCF8489815.1 hypothetical protein [Rhodospirillum sp.]MCF8501620.1 hypothetical protein [Rhodospirillum sp.]